MTAPHDQSIRGILEPHLAAGDDIGFAIGTINLADSPSDQILYAGRLVNDAGDPLPLDGHTCFELASISKTMCATLFAACTADDTTLGNSIVSAYHPEGLPPLSPHFDAMPLLALANYTSGLPPDAHGPPPPPAPPRPTTPTPLPHPYTVADMYDYLSTLAWTIPASSVNYTYSNLAFALLAESLPVAMASTLSFGAMLEERILSPLGMASTRMFDQVARDRLPRGYGPDGQLAKPGSPTFPAYYGAGGAVSTPADMMTWLEFNMGIRVSPAHTPLLPALQRPSTTVVTQHGSRLGLGWFLTDVPTIDGPTLATVWKDGAYSGYRSYITFLASPQPGTVASQAGVFVLTNSAANADEIGRTILCLLCGYLPVPEDVPTA